MQCVDIMILSTINKCLSKNKAIMFHETNHGQCPLLNNCKIDAQNYTSHYNNIGALNKQNNVEICCGIAHSSINPDILH